MYRSGFSSNKKKFKNFSGFQPMLLFLLIYVQRRHCYCKNGREGKFCGFSIKKNRVRATRKKKVEVEIKKKFLWCCCSTTRIWIISKNLPVYSGRYIFLSSVSLLLFLSILIASFHDFFPFLFISIFFSFPFGFEWKVLLSEKLVGKKSKLIFKLMVCHWRIVDILSHVCLWFILLEIHLLLL